MRTTSIALFIVSLAMTPAFAADKDDVMVPVKKFIDSFNKGDVKRALVTCAEQTSIIDEFPPHEWHGPGACATWANEFAADAQKNRITDGVVSLGNPRHIDIS